MRSREDSWSRDGRFNRRKNTRMVTRELVPHVGQPILAAAAFQAALVCTVVEAG